MRFFIVSVICGTMKTKYVHMTSVVNAANVSKTGGIYTIKNVCGVVDDMVMNGRLYPADQCKTGAPGLEGKPAPAGHPKNSAGQYISATNGEALMNSWIGSYAKNARHESGRTLVDILVNEAAAKSHPDGVKLVERLDAAIAGTNSEPIHVSTGLNMDEVKASGESLGKKYSSIATNLKYDHLAILLNEQGAGTPEQGVGMFVNSAGDTVEVETVITANEQSIEDKRHKGLLTLLKRLLVNGSELSFEQITDGLRALLTGKNVWPREVFDKYFVWIDYDTETLYRQDYTVSSDGNLSLTSEPVEVVREVKYKPVINHEKDDSVKDHILAALNAAGIQTAGLDDTQTLAAYNALVAKPHIEAVKAANDKVATFEANAKAAENAERDTLAAKLAVNSSLTAEDFKAMPLARLKELDAKAAPVVVGNSNPAKPGDEFAAYDINNPMGVK